MRIIQYLFYRVVLHDIIDILDWKTAFSEGCPVHGRMSGRIRGLYPPDSKSYPPVVTIKVISRHWHMSPGVGRAKSLLLETHWFKVLLNLINVTGPDTWKAIDKCLFSFFSLHSQWILWEERLRQFLRRSSMFFVFLIPPLFLISDTLNPGFVVS